MIARLFVTQLQERQYRMLAQYMAKFPIAKSSKVVQDEICSLVQERLNSSIEKNESEIDRMVQLIYNFDNEEIAYINNL